MENKDVKPANWWLTDDSFLAKVIYHDKYYFQSLCLHISNFVKNVPIPVLTTWDYKHEQIYFIVGNEKKAFKVDVNIAYDDYIFLVEEWLYTFYPQYTVNSIKEVSYTDKEIIEIVEKENVNLNDAILMKKNVKFVENGIIERAYFKGDPEDSFKFNFNGDYSLRMSGTMDNPYPLSSFFKDFRKVKGDKNKRDFIFNNSIKIRDLKKKVEVKEINYLGMMMKNFVEIRLNSLRKFTFKKVDTRKWKWSNFILIMETDILQYDILNFLKSNKIKIKEKE